MYKLKLKTWKTFSWVSNGNKNLTDPDLTVTYIQC